MPTKSPSTLTLAKFSPPAKSWGFLKTPPPPPNHHFFHHTFGSSFGHICQHSLVKNKDIFSAPPVKVRERVRKKAVTYKHLSLATYKHMCNVQRVMCNVQSAICSMQHATATGWSNCTPGCWILRASGAWGW